MQIRRLPSNQNHDATVKLMCGIAGIVILDGQVPIQHCELGLMADTLAHRGPDDAGAYLDSTTGRCGLAHRRLAIIDLAGGKQPLANEDQTIWITYNGECYNFPQLRRQLQTAGHQFATNCDTEVIVHLYEEHGPDCVNHLRGMFAFAIWDQKKQQLFLARDRLGQKPLYYALHDGRFIFASECKAILQTHDFPRRPDHQALTQYLLLQYVPHPASAFTDIKQLPPAHCMIVNAQPNDNPQPRRYWTIPTETTFSGTFEDAAEQLRDELAQATKMRMVSDVPLGAFLSGGIDSTIIVGLMSQASDQPVRTCAIGFGEPRYNELPFARQAARHFNSLHNEHIVTPDCHDALDQLSFYYDEPFADCSALPTFYLSRLARQRVTVAITGDGADECFGGYDRYRALHLSHRMNQHRLFRWLARQRFWQNLSAGQYRSPSRRLKRFMTAAQLPPAQRYLKWMAVFDPDMLTDLLSENPATDAPAPSQSWNYLDDFFKPTYDFGPEPARHLAQAMHADACNYLPGDLNTKIDRASMSVGLELRCPFQDHKVVELAYRLPALWRHDGKHSKRILRHACADLLPDPISRRPKMGFGVPVGRWFRNELRQHLIDTVLSTRARQRGYFNVPAIEKLIAQNDKQQEDHGHRLWALLMLERWHQRYIDQTPAVRPPTYT